MQPDRKDLAPGLSISRILTGLWQVADQERDGKTTRSGAAGARRFRPMPSAGFDTFDMADHYGSAELITGEMLRHWKGGTPPGPSPNGARNPDR
jgi:aryl-alcohol dehydrogenase-like predicted oxidoreductase